jgi:hypothetical protein
MTSGRQKEAPNFVWQHSRTFYHEERPAYGIRSVIAGYISATGKMTFIDTNQNEVLVQDHVEKCDRFKRVHRGSFLRLSENGLEVDVPMDQIGDVFNLIGDPID